MTAVAAETGMIETSRKRTVQLFQALGFVEILTSDEIPTGCVPQPIFIAIARFHHRSRELSSAQDRFDGTLMKEAATVSAVISAPSVVDPRE